MVEAMIPPRSKENHACLYVIERSSDSMLCAACESRFQQPDHLFFGDKISEELLSDSLHRDAFLFVNNVSFKAFDDYVLSYGNQ